MYRYKHRKDDGRCSNRYFSRRLVVEPFSATLRDLAEVLGEVTVRGDGTDPASTPYREEAGLFRSDLSFFPERSWDLIESFQPYHRAARPELELLGILDELVRIDKHRFVIAPERLVKLEMSPTETRIIRQRLDEPHRQWVPSRVYRDNFEPRGTFDIVMYPPLRGQRGFSALELGDIHDLIANELIPAFAGFLA